MIEFWYCGFLGCALIILGMTASAIAYRGRQGERYSPFNHFISELGERGTARLAAVFNGGVIAGGLCPLPLLFLVGGGRGAPRGGAGVAPGGKTRPRRGDMFFQCILWKTPPPPQKKRQKGPRGRPPPPGPPTPPPAPAKKGGAAGTTRGRSARR